LFEPLFSLLVFLHRDLPFGVAALKYFERRLPRSTREGGENPTIP
jgi:hypothetical protein